MPLRCPKADFGSFEHDVELSYKPVSAVDHSPEQVTVFSRYKM